MNLNIKRVSRANPQRPIPPVELSGKWIAWNADCTEIIAHAQTLDELDQLARATGHEHFIVEKLPRVDRVFIGAI